MELKAIFTSAEGKNLLRRLATAFGGTLSQKTLVKYGLREWLEIKRTGEVEPYMEEKDCCYWTYLKEEQKWKSGCGCLGLAIIEEGELECPNCLKGIVILPGSKYAIRIEQTFSELLRELRGLHLKWNDSGYTYNPEKDQIQAYIKLSSPVSFKTETVERLKDLELKKIQVREERKLELDFVKNVSVSNLNERKSNE